MDRALLELVTRHRTDWLNTASRNLMDLGYTTRAMALLAVIGVAFVGVTRRWGLGLAIGSSFVVSAALAQVLKAIIDRPRPSGSLTLVSLSGSAMPSSHALRTAAMAAAAVATLSDVRPITSRVVGLVLAAAVAVVGLCMVYLGGHWLTDVLVGWALGVAVGLGAAQASKVVSARLGRGRVGGHDE
jgi:undecaprenyl-diphosphatase